MSKIEPDEHYYAVIMAGGGGTRLWPLSRQFRPKQMLALFDERTMFQMAVERILELFPAERIYVVTVAEQAQALYAQRQDIPQQNFLIEPAARGTAAAIGLAAAVLQQRDPQAIMAVLGSDHYIHAEAAFRDLLRAAWQAARDGYLATLGIKPEFAATGFGYIRRGERLSEYSEFELYRAAEFKEKPAPLQAEAMATDGQHYWNSGMFIWQVRAILAEFERQMPVLFAGLEQIGQALGGVSEQATIERVWLRLRTETIDYGVMEHAQGVVVLPGSGLGWSDIGGWDSLYEALAGDAQGNVVRGAEHIGLDSERVLVYASQPGRLIVTIGVEDLVVVDAGDVTLVCDKRQAQRVREVVRLLRERGEKYV